MNPIQLTPEHKTKLLEMCNKLFPKEGIWFKILDGQIYYSKNGKFPGFSIHWFEFAITHLCTKLFKDLKLYLKIDIMSYRGRLVQNTNHPVDYLYEEFKKLKL